MDVGTRPVRGRRQELAMIASGIERAAAGKPSTIVLVGEPGIGKSRLAVEAASAATAAGFAALWGRAWEAGGAPAYWPWRQVCEGMTREGPIAQLWGRRGESATDPDQARFDLFDAVTHAIAARAAEAPLLVVLDDLHAADVPSLELVAFATRHLRAGRVLWLLTWRDAEAARSPVREPLARIAREATVAPLSALGDIDANELIDDVYRDADIELRAKLLHATSGNPLFLLETLAALATGRVHAAELEQLPLAQGIATIVHDRMAPLDAATRELAAAASVVGRDVTLARWTAAAAADGDAIRRAAAQLCEAGMLVPLARDRWRFGHDLVREAIYRAANVVEIHGRLARELDAQVAAGDMTVVGERAHHALHARGELRQMLDWTIAAADHARSQCAYEEAIATIDLALAREPAAHHDAALQLARGKALLDVGKTDAAREAFATTIALARNAGDPRMPALAALGYGARYVFGDLPIDLIAMIDQALLELPDDEPELRARLLARKAAALTPAVDPLPVLDMARDANHMIASSVDPAARLEAFVAIGAAFADFAHPRERIPINETVVALARARGDRALELRGLTRLACDYISAGDLSRADALLATREALARSLVQPRFIWQSVLLRSMRAMLHGDFATCDAAVAEAATYAEHDPNVRRCCAVHRMWLLLHSDRVDELRAHVPVTLETMRTMSRFVPSATRAIVAVRTGDFADARRELAAIEAPYGGSVNTVAALGEVAAEVGSAAAQHAAYDLLAPYADTFAAWGPFAMACGPPIAATLGHLASGLGDLERARAHFESALMMTTTTNAIVGRAWASYWYARALAKAGDPDAARVVEDAIRDASRANIPNLVARCRTIAVAAAPVAAPRAAPAAALAWSMVEQAGSWLVAIADRQFLVPNLRGMAMLARLAASPHVEIHSLELVSGSPEPDIDGGDSGELLDEKARAQYRKRLASLADELDDARSRGDVARAEAARDEHEALLKELSRAVGVGGRVRRAGAAGERARTAAQRRLREAIKKIGELDDELGSHLSKAIRTGTFCAYRP